MKEISNEKFNEAIYDLASGSSMWAYISHYFFIVLSGKYKIRPFNLTYPQGVIANLIFTEIAILISYIILTKCQAKYYGDYQNIKSKALKVVVP